MILPITLAGFAYFGLSSGHTSDQFFVMLTVETGSITLLTMWYMLSRTWYYYQLIAFYRMREIETELGLWHYRYSLFLRQPRKERTMMLEQMKGKEKVRFQKPEEQHEDFLRIGLRRTISILSVVFSIGWIALIIREYLLAF